LYQFIELLRTLGQIELLVILFVCSGVKIMKKYQQIIFFIALLLMVTLIGQPVQAQTETIGVATLSDGSETWDPLLDKDGTNGIVRTFDSTTYEVLVTRVDTPNFTREVLMTISLGNFALPPSYTNDPVNPPLTRVEKFIYESLIPVTGGCKNPIEGQPAAGNPSKNSYISSDGQTLYCYVPDGQHVNMKIPAWVLATTPNGTKINPPNYKLTVGGSDIPAIVLPGGELRTLTVAAKPNWDVKHYVNWKNFQMIEKSGPSGEDGYVLPIMVGIYKQGSRKGSELLKPSFSLISDFSNTSFPNAQIPTTWLVNNPRWFGPNYKNITLLDNNYCLGVMDTYHLTGNRLDGANYHVSDFQRALTTSERSNIGAFTVANGGVCSITPTANQTFTMTIQGTDMTLDHFPTRHTQVASSRTLITIGNLDAPENEWWVADKWYIIWIPKTDIAPPVPSIVREFVSSIRFDPANSSSISGQLNQESDPTNNQVSYNIFRGYRTAFDDMAAQWRWGPPQASLTAFPDPNSVWDENVNQAIPGQFYSSYTRITNTGSDRLDNGTICYKFDNSRAEMIDTTAVGTDLGLNDKSIGVVHYFIAGSLLDMPGYNSQLGVSLTERKTWASFNNVTNEYDEPLYTGSDQADSGCGNDEALWFDSVAALKAAGYNLQDVNRIRIKFEKLTPGTNLLMFAPLMVRDTALTSGVDILADGTKVPFAANASTMGMYIPHQSYIEADNYPRTYQSDAIKVVGKEWAKITKNSITHPKDPLQPAVYPVVGPLTQIEYSLQVNLSSNDYPHLTNVTVWDVLPRYTTYMPDSSTFGGESREPTFCQKGSTGLPKDIFPNGIPAGYTVCRWDLPLQLVPHARFGDRQGDIPTLNFRVIVDVDAPAGTIVYNTAFADSTNNELIKAFYVDGDQGFRCDARQACSRDDHAARVNADIIFLAQKFTRTPIVLEGTPFEFTMYYGTRTETTKNVRVLDILPYNNEIDPYRLPKTKYQGTYHLSRLLTAPIAQPTSPYTIADPNIRFYYSSRLPQEINANPYDSSQCLYSGAGSCTAGTTVFCQSSDFGQSGCPADLNSVTAFMLLPNNGALLPKNGYYAVTIPLTPVGNAKGDLYSNHFTLGLTDIVFEKSNIATVFVYPPDPALGKIVDKLQVTSHNPLTYSIVVKNGTTAGTGPLLPGATLTVTDILPQGVIIESIDTEGRIEGSWDCDFTQSAFTCSYTVPEGKIISAGEVVDAPILVHARLAIGTPATPPGVTLTNRACVALTGAQIDPVTSNNCAQAGISVFASNSMEILKVEVLADPPAKYEVGDTVPFQITVQNTGNSELTNVTLVDDNAVVDFAACTPPPSTVTATGAQSWPLAIAEKIICPATHVVTQDDFDVGEIINKATANSDQVGPLHGYATVTLITNPLLEITKTEVAAEPKDLYKVGDTIRFEIVVKNSGDVTLSNVMVQDAAADTLICDPAVPVAKFEVGGTIRCEATRVVKPADAAAGKVVNRAITTSDQSDPAETSVEVPVKKTEIILPETGF